MLELANNSFLWIPPVAVLLDLIFADPLRFPHPVQMIGLLLNIIEPYARHFRYLKLAGLFCTIFVTLVTMITVNFFISLPHEIGLFFSVYFSWAGLALGGLIRSGKNALFKIFTGSINKARYKVSMLVSRDVKFQDKPQLYASLAETISENLNDAFIAPFFWLLVGGPVAMWGYKAVSTMDSCWGYKNERWIKLGWASAKFDDVLAYIPARLSAIFLYITGFLFFSPYGKNMPKFTIKELPKYDTYKWPSWKTIVKQAVSMESPNAGWPMAVAAWIHCGSMGGPTLYHGKLIDKPLRGPANKEWSVINTAALIRHTLLAGAVGALILWGIQLFY